MQLPPARSDPDYTRVREHDIRELWDASLEPHVAASYQSRLSALEEIVRARFEAPARILDVGCAQGTLGLRLAESGHRVTLLDIREGHIAYARARHTAGKVEFRVGRIEQEPDLAGLFDLTFFTETIEHMRSPGQLLRALRNTLRPGGFLVLTTPNADYVLSRLDSYGAAPQSVIDRAEENSADGDAHRFLYTQEELVSVVRAAALEVLERRFFLPFWVVGHARTRYLHRLLYSVRRSPVHIGPHPEVFLGPLRRWLCSSQLLLARRPEKEL
jgi:2-polyprenyl-3-methyl-5-hydroxy-6-metoxy-1,4-benzoquinol methylase